VTDGDWTDFQRVEAEISPTFGAGDSWAGLIALRGCQQLLLRGHSHQPYIRRLQARVA
jgi:hypothetical protein